MHHHRQKVYEIRPSLELKQPFRFDFDKPTSKDYQNDEITEYFNFGFNDTTMKGYINKLRMTVKTYDKGGAKRYVHNLLQLTRLNDEIPIDFGGFSNFYDSSLIQNSAMPNLEDGAEHLMDYFIQHHTLSAEDRMPLLSFVRAMYPKDKDGEEHESNTLDAMITHIEKNLERKYDEIIKKNEQLKEQSKQQTHYRSMGNRRGMDRGDRGDRGDWKPWGYRGDRPREDRENFEDRGKYRDFRNRRDSRDRDREREKDKDRERERDHQRDKEKDRNKDESKDRRRKDRSAQRSRDKKKDKNHSRSKSESRSRKRKQDKERSRKDKKRHNRSRSRSKSEKHKKKSRYD